MQKCGFQNSYQVRGCGNGKGLLSNENEVENYFNIGDNTCRTYRLLKQGKQDC